MTTESRAILTVDHGTATTAVALLGHAAGRWRLLGSSAAPAAIGADALARRVIERLRIADPGLANDVGLAASGDQLRRVTSRTSRPPVIAVVAGAGRMVTRLTTVAGLAGWRTRSAALDASDPLAVMRLLCDPAVEAIVAGASDPPGADERARIEELIALVAAAVARRPELTVVLAGGMAGHAEAVDALAPGRPGPTLIAPPADTGTPVGEALRALLDGLRAAEDDGRRALARAVGTLAATSGRRIELVEIGHDGATRVSATDGVDGPVTRTAIVPAAALIPDDLPDATVDGVTGWSTLPLDRLRIRDRLRELRVAPWGEAYGEGAQLRLAAARAALVRLVEATPAFAAEPIPDLVIAAGGVWCAAPGSAVGLALADVLRRPGAAGLALDHARLLAPLGTIADDAERARLLADLADDLLAPLGSVVMPSGLRAGRTAGRLVVHAEGGATELDLVPGGLELVDLPPGERAVIELQFRDPVMLGARGRHFAIDVAGGLGGLLVDLRDVPMRLPERLDRRRELLGAWQTALWAGLDP